MGKIYTDNSTTIGNTPLVRLQRIVPDGANILVKIESRNPSFSVKCRIGANMIWDAEKRGVLKSGMEIVEATSGNTGIALAYVAAARGYKIHLTMPSSMSEERKQMLKGLGANLILTTPEKGMKGAIEKAEALADKEPEKYFLARQFENPANPEIHYQTTGPEIWDDTDGDVGVFVAGVGTGGTISGTGRYLREKNAQIKLIAVEPSASPVISQTLAGEEVKPAPHKIQGIGAGFIPQTFAIDLIDAVERIDDDDAIATSQRLMQEEGIICGISSGASVAAAIRLAQQPEYKGKTIVTVLPDTGERYLSTALFQG